MEVWVEKYRPKKLDDVLGQEEVIKGLKSYIISKNMPHLMFSGKPGTGKTTAALCFVRELFGDEWTRNFMELNASDERGIDTVREKIKDFAKSSPDGDYEFRIIFLDEADALTQEAQAALRRTMEKYTNACRFILSVNYSSKIIDPIQSRCAVYRFKSVPDSAVMERISHIAKVEGLELSSKTYQAIQYVTQGDMRRAINAIQAAAMFNKKIDVDLIYKTSSMARPEDIEDLILLSLQGDFMKAHVKLNYLLHDQGLAGTDITGQIYKHMFNINVPDKLKLELIDHIGEIDFRISEGSNENVQLGALVSKFALYGINKR